MGNTQRGSTLLNYARIFQSLGISFGTGQDVEVWNDVYKILQKLLESPHILKHFFGGHISVYRRTVLLLSQDFAIRVYITVPFPCSLQLVVSTQILQPSTIEKFVRLFKDFYRDNIRVFKSKIVNFELSFTRGLCGDERLTLYICYKASCRSVYAWLDHLLGQHFFTRVIDAVSDVPELLDLLYCICETFLDGYNSKNFVLSIMKKYMFKLGLL